jgi:hypothetical protein
MLPRRLLPMIESQVLKMHFDDTGSFTESGVDFRDRDNSSERNPALRERIKRIERVALKYAPLQGPEVDHLFEEIEHVKDVFDGDVVPPKSAKTKPKKKKKVQDILL